MRENMTSFWGFIIALLLFAAERWFQSWYESATLRRRLIRVLLIESVATINKLKGLLEFIFDDCQHIAESREHSQAILQSLSSGFVVSPPIDDPLTLIKLLESSNSTEIVHLYDRWCRFLMFESRYCEAYKSLWNEYSKDNSLRSLELERDYWQQISGNLIQLYILANDACYYSVVLYRRFADPTNPHDIESARKLWSDWSEVARLRELFDCERQRTQWEKQKNPWRAIIALQDVT